MGAKFIDTKTISYTFILIETIGIAFFFAYCLNHKLNWYWIFGETVFFESIFVLLALTLKSRFLRFYFTILLSSFWGLFSWLFSTSMSNVTNSQRLSLILAIIVSLLLNWNYFPDVTDGEACK